MMTSFRLTDDGAHELKEKLEIWCLEYADCHTVRDDLPFTVKHRASQ